MRKKNRSFLLMSLVSASLLVGAFAVVQAQNSGAPAVKATNWSDPATWPNHKVPAAGDKVIIEQARKWSWTSARRRWAVCPSTASSASQTMPTWS